MKLKKMISAVLVLVLTCALLAGCQANNQNAGKLKIGIAQKVEHPSLDTIRTSFIEELKALGLDENKVEIEYQSANNDASVLTTIFQTFVGDKKDLIVAIATPTAQAAAAATDTIPILFSAVTDPVGAGLAESLEKPGKNTTGTSDAIPADKILDLAGQLTPEMKTVGLLYTTSEVNSISVINQAKEYGKTLGLEFVEAPITNVSEVQQAMQSLVGKVDVIFTPIDNTVASAMPTVAELARQNKIPIYVGADSMVADGGFATVGINYEDLGKKTAEMAKKILVDGVNPAEFPVVTLSDFSVVINKTTAEALGISIPDEIAETAQILE